jgi:hypothetical protein
LYFRYYLAMQNNRFYRAKEPLSQCRTAGIAAC